MQHIAENYGPGMEPNAYGPPADPQQFARAINPGRFETDATKLGRLMEQWTQANISYRANVEAKQAYRNDWRRAKGVIFYQELSELFVKHMNDGTQAYFASEALDLFDKTYRAIYDEAWAEATS